MLFSRRFSRKCLEVISFKFFVCFIFNVSLGSAPKRKNFDIQCNTRVASGGQFTLNYHTPSLMKAWLGHNQHNTKVKDSSLITRSRLLLIAASASSYSKLLQKFYHYSLSPLSERAEET